MPELPEVHTTATGLQGVLPGLYIKDVWTDYDSAFHKGKNNIKDKTFFKTFHKKCVGKKILSAGRRGKNVLIHLSGELTILVHMKMTGHLLYGVYKKTTVKKAGGKSAKSAGVWLAKHAGPLRDDPFNARVHFIIILSNGKHVALSDTRKFAKVTLLETKKLTESHDLRELGPEPIDKSFSFEIFKKCLLKKPNGKIKTVLMDQSLIAGIGNIYSDEILWKSGVHPESKPSQIPNTLLKKMYTATRSLLAKGIDFGGDSMSDYRNVNGEKGRFQLKHKVYQRKDEECLKHGCRGIISRKVIGGRSAHFCNTHQKLLQ